MKELFVISLVVFIYICVLYIIFITIFKLTDYIILRKYLDINDAKSVFNSKGEKYSNKEFKRIIKKINKKLLYRVKHHKEFCPLCDNELISPNGNKYEKTVIQYYKNLGFEVWRTVDGIRIEGWC
ncbi:MAG: hypothetical protein ACI4SM_03465 [Candidatus Gastranaerophilaceae bacterium]